MASSTSGTTSRLGLADAWGKLRSLRFNQDQSCFICALDDGIRVFFLGEFFQNCEILHTLPSTYEHHYKQRFLRLANF